MQASVILMMFFDLALGLSVLLKVISNNQHHGKVKSCENQFGTMVGNIYDCCHSVSKVDLDSFQLTLFSHDENGILA